MSIEDRLREAMSDDSYAMPGWCDPLGRLSPGLQRIRRRRRIAVVSTAAAVLLLGAAVPVAWQAARTSSTPDVPAAATWVDKPVADSTVALARRSPRADRPACVGKNMEQTAWTETSASAESIHTVVLKVNDSDRCTLRGTPHLAGTDTRTGKRTEIQSEALGQTGGARQFPATIDPGEPARVDVAVTSQCDHPAPQPVRFVDLAVSVLGREVPIAGFSIETPCPLGVGEWGVQPPLLNLPFLIATITSPGQVRRGQQLRYEVSVLNSGNTDYQLDPCPIYRQSLDGDSTTYELNCAIRSIRAHRSASFEMVLGVPAETVAGPKRLRWMAVASNGEVVIADLPTDGVEVTATS